MARRLVFIAFLWVCIFSSPGQVKPFESIPQIKKSLEKSGNLADRAGLLCKLALLYVYKQGEVPTDLDSGLLLANEAAIINSSLHDKAIEAKIYFIRANALREKGDTAQAHHAINKSLEIYNALPNLPEHGDAYIELSNYYNIYTKEGCLGRKECYEQALAQFQAAGAKEKQADALKNLGDFNQILRNYGLSIINLHEALAIYSSIGYKNMQGVYDLLGIVSTNMGDYSNAIKYGLLAVQAAENLNDTSIQLCTIYNRLGVAYGNWSKWEDAGIYEQKALAIAIKYHDKDAIETVLLTLCHLLKGRSDWQEILMLIKSADKYTRPWNLEDSLYMSVFYNMTYVAGKDFSAAGKYADNLVKITPRVINRQLPVHTVYSCLSNYFLAINKYETAKKYIKHDLEYSTKYSNKRTISIDYLLASKADSGTGNFKAALNEYQVYKAMSDSMLNESKSFQFAQMQVVYETEKKDRDLRLQQQNLEVVTNKNKLQEARLKKANLTRDIIVIAALSLLSLLFTGYKFKQRHNKQLQLQQKEINHQNILLKQFLREQQKLVEEKEGLVKEIHHRVKNNLQMIISLLNAQSEFLDHPTALNAIKESRERMQAIALIHQKLYQPDQGTLINMNSYIRELVAYLYSSFADPERIKFIVEVQPIQMDISQSVPLGLILNEAITNVVKYAFQMDRKGKVTIELYHVNDAEIRLKISDNGRGFPAGFDLSESNSLGIQLIKLFAEQLEGTLQFTGTNGVEITLTFKQHYPIDKFSTLNNIWQSNGKNIDS